MQCFRQVPVDVARPGSLLNDRFPVRRGRGQVIEVTAIGFLPADANQDHRFDGLRFNGTFVPEPSTVTFAGLGLSGVAPG